MSLNSPTFVFGILPILLILLFVIGRRIVFGFLLLVSVIFYIWLDPAYAPFVFLGTLVNYLGGNYLRINKIKVAGIILIGGNILALAFFKLMISPWMPEGWVQDILPILPGHVPVGISFWVFTSVAYLVDCYKDRVKEKQPFLQHTALQFFFPRVISGPIIRLSSFSKEQVEEPGLSQAAGGIRRFLLGFIKKVLVADILGEVVSRIFSLEPASLPVGTSWIGVLFYTLQIYYDFSGYTDMALGLGLCFGVKLPENFNFPYMAKSIGEFWRRWHITLSNWFRDYLFFPLERRRRGRPIGWQHVNVMIVFIATGLWHGFSWNYLVWGGLHGLVIVIENALGDRLKSIPSVLRNAFTLLVLIISWVFFRAEDFPYALAFLRQMFSFRVDIAPLPLSLFQPIGALAWAAFILGVLFSFPWWEGIKPFFVHVEGTWVEKVYLIGVDLMLLVLFVWGVITMFGSSFTSFLYAQF